MKTFFFFCAVTVLLLVVIGGVADAITFRKHSKHANTKQQRVGAGPAPLINATKPFWQLNATRMLYSTSKPLAAWPHVPFAMNAFSYVGGGNDIALFDESSGRYVFLANGQSRVVSVSEDDLLQGAYDAFKTHTGPAVQWANGTAWWVGVAASPSQCVGAQLTPSACGAGGSSKKSSLIFAGPTSLVACSFSGKSELNCNVAPITGAINELAPYGANNMALSARPTASEKHQVAVLVSSVMALYSLYTTDSGASFKALPVKLLNTTGGVAQYSNVTWVSCLPAAHYANKQNKQQSGSSSSRSNSKIPLFFGSDCFAAVSTMYCTSNICPADLLFHIAVQAGAGGAPVVKMVDPLPFQRIPANICARPTAGVYTPKSDRLFWGNPVCVNTMSNTGALQHIGGFTGGLPANNIWSGAWLNLSTALSQMRALGADVESLESDGVVFFGTVRGVVAKLPDSDGNADADEVAEEGKWKLLLGGRWLPGGDDGTLTAGMDVYVMASGGKSVLAATSTGLSLMWATVWTPQQKIQHFEDVVSPRNLRADGLYKDSRLRRWGDVRSYYDSTSANSGLWTGMWVTSQALRWVASGKTDQVARANCWKGFAGLELLVNCTGKDSGFMGRDCIQSAKSPGSSWHPSPTMPGWWFWGNASSDEVDGHLSALSTLYYLVAETPAEKARVVALLKRELDAIIAGGLVLHEWHGLPSHWAHWAPKDLIDSPFWYDDVGINSFQIMGFLSAGYAMTGNETYAAVFENLRDVHGYDRTLVSATITQSTDINFSDNELIFTAMWTLFLSGRFPMANGQPNPLFASVAEFAAAGLDRTWRFVKKGKPSLWAAMYAIMQPTFDVTGAYARYYKSVRGELEAAVEDYVVSHPTDNCDWPIDNGQRLNAVWNPHDARNGQAHSVLENPVFPGDELSQWMWNGNPFSARQGSGYDQARATNLLYPFYAALAIEQLAESY